MGITQLVEEAGMKKSSFSIVCSGALLFLYGTAHANILHVPGDYSTIQAALVFAGTGDTILVAPGTYYEHIVWPSTQGINLVSEYGADSTIIDGLGSLRAITIETNIDSTTVIKGFAIVNGNEDYGGGIYCVLASPTISNNTIMNNDASFGGGIFCHEGAPTIIQNRITDNVATGDGGGISCSYFSSPKIVDNIIENNSAFYTSGGGIYSVDSWPEITGNTVSSNSADLGGGMYFYKSTPIITNNVVSNNDAQYGGGLCFTESDGDVNHNNMD
jgi:parallel beta-helix repeat protein